MNGSDLMEEALRIREESGVLDAADFLTGRGISYELALIALVGSEKARRKFGLDYPRIKFK